MESISRPLKESKRTENSNNWTEIWNESKNIKQSVTNRDYQVNINEINGYH